MKYSIAEIKASLSREKKMEDSLFGIVVHRPLSYPLTYFCVNCKVSAWAVSVVSSIIAFFGCFLICLESYLLRWIGIALLNLWAILDCVDGNVARVTKSQSSKGAFMDAESGYFVCAFVYLSFGIAAFHTTTLTVFPNNYIFIILGAIASISDILSRLIHQKYVSSVDQSEDKRMIDKKTSVLLIRKRVSTELGIAGFVLLGGIIAQIFNLYNVLIIFYSAFCFLTLASTFIIYSLKAKS